MVENYFIWHEEACEARYVKWNIGPKLSFQAKPAKFVKSWPMFSGLAAHFSKPIIALKLWVRAGRFEYHEPYIQNDFFFTYKGVRATFGVPVGIVPDHLESWNFFWYLLWPILMGKCSQLIQIQKFCIFEHPYPPPHLVWEIIVSRD